MAALRVKKLPKMPPQVQTRQPVSLSRRLIFGGKTLRLVKAPPRDSPKRLEMVPLCCRASLALLSLLPLRLSNWNSN